MMKILSSEKIWQGRIFEIERDCLRDASGREMIREVVRHPGGAGALAVNADGCVALVRQYRHPAGRELLEIPAGKLERGEDPAACAARELEEEIGFRAGIIRELSVFYSTPGFCEEQLHIFLATDLTSVSRKLDEDEVIDVIWLPLVEAVMLIGKGDIVDSKTIIALLLAERVLAE
jgi:ADP-ribose pyrophosphatase